MSSEKLSTIDYVEGLGRAMEVGSISRVTAISSLVGWSEGGLTEYGAADLIDRWRTVRSDPAGALVVEGGQS